MSGTHPEQRAEDPAMSADEVEDLCARFSEECSDGRPQIAEWLKKVEDESRRGFFRRLLAIELARRTEAGETIVADEYYRQFPEYSDDIDFEIGRVLDTPQRDSRSVSLDRTISQRGGSESTGDEEHHRAGDVIGRYRLERHVGGGGFGIVWQAFDPELNRPVAVKLARSGRSFSDSVLQQTRDEARKAAAVTHRGIVPVYDVVPCGGSLGIVSEFIPGQTLQDLIQAGRVSQGDAVAIIIQIAEALHHAHKHGLVHRDVKPGNILLRPNGDAVLTDFGLAVTEVDLLREPGGTVGTRSYMSPEQAGGDSNRVDARSDVFSLGVVLYQLVTGRLPWVATTPDEYRDQILHRNPRPLRTIDDSIDPELERICLRCLEKPLAARYATCDELARDLTALQSRLAAPASKRATARWLTAAALLLTAAIAIALFWPDRKRDPQPNGGKTNTADDGKSPPPEKTSQPEPPPKPDPFAWRPLLDKPPVIVSFPPGDDQDDPVYNAERKRYSVHAERNRWVAKAGETDGRPFEIRAVVSIDKWIGHGGIIWGLRDDPEAFPKKRIRCLYVEFLRSDERSTPKLWASEAFIERHSLWGWRVRSKKTIDTLEVVVPQKKEIPLTIRVTKNGASIKWGNNADWEPRTTFWKVEWLPAGKTGVGITGGFSRESRMRDLSLRYLRLP